MFINAGVIGGASTQGTIVTLSNETTGVSGDTWAEIQFLNDGTVWEETDTSSATQVDAATDWIRPTSASSGNYEIWAEAFSVPGSGSLSGPTLDTWHSLADSAHNKWRFSKSGTPFEQYKLKIKIREGDSPFTELTGLVIYTLRSGTTA